MPSNKVPPATALRSKLHRTEKNKLRNRRRNRNRRNSNKVRSSNVNSNQQHLSKPSKLNVNLNKNIEREAQQHTRRRTTTATRRLHTTSSTPSSIQWNALYQNAVQWQTQHQAEYWKNVAVRQGRRYNELLQRFEKLVEARSGGTGSGTQDTPSATCADETDDEEDSGNCGGAGSEVETGNASAEDDQSHEEYLKFMEISRRHQMERALEREASDN